MVLPRHKSVNRKNDICFIENDVIVKTWVVKHNCSKIPHNDTPQFIMNANDTSQQLRMYLLFISIVFPVLFH